MRKLRLGVVGLGSVVREIYEHLYYASEYSPLLDVAAICEVNPAALAEFGDKHGVPKDKRFADCGKMIGAVELDAVHVNTPDRLHRDPTIRALKAGLDVLLPKPAADTVEDVHAMIQTAATERRLISVDYHKRDDHRISEAAARYQSGRYGKWQVAVWYMLDKLCVSDPNHVPRFFASANFAEKNSPATFLTVHMADSFIHIVNMKPVSVRARGFKQKLPSLRPIAVNGYDCVDTEVVFENGGVAHIITGWHVPDTAYALSVQDSRIVCTDGLIDLAMGNCGYSEVTKEGAWQINATFTNFKPDGTVSGFGMSRPGEALRRFLKHREGSLSQPEVEAMMTPMELGFYSTLVIQAAEESLAAGKKIEGGSIVHGVELDLREFLAAKLGAPDARLYLP